MKGRILFLTVFTSIALLMTACSDSNTVDNTESGIMTEEIPAGAGMLENGSQITPDAAKVQMDLGEEIILVDVRTSEEYESGYIGDAILVPIESLEEEAPMLLPDLNATYYVYCEDGTRSGEAVRKMIDMGYTNVYDLGGVINWPYDLNN